jgi:hypothetical protein
LNDSIQRDANQRDHTWTVTADLLVERVPSVDILGWRKIVNPGGRPADEIGNPKAPLEKPMVVGVGDRFRHQSRVCQQPPEAIRVTGKVMTRQRGSHPRIDAHKEHPKSGPDPILEA